MEKKEMFDILNNNQKALNSLPIDFWVDHTKNASEHCLNWEIPAVDGEKFWKSISLENGWKIQVNTITQNSRILDQDKVRRCFGRRDIVLAPIIEALGLTDGTRETNKEDDNASNILREYKKLFDDGIITEEDFNEAKRRVIGRI